MLTAQNIAKNWVYASNNRYSSAVRQYGRLS